MKKFAYGLGLDSASRGCAVGECRRTDMTISEKGRSHMRRFAIYLLFGGCLLAVLWPQPSSAQNLLQTTYNCPESNQLQWFAGTPLNCDGLTSAGNWYPNGDTSKGSQITSAANFPGGGGGRGQRHWIGDGVNSTSGGTTINFPRTGEFWLRAYVRYERGFTWSPSKGIAHKMFYPEIVNVAGRGNLWFAFGFVDGVFGMQSYAPNPKSTRTWWSIFGQPSDESWHALEWHMKVDTNGANGIAEGWVDGVLEFRRTNIDFGTHSGWASVQLGQNQGDPMNGRIMFFDFDDVVISLTGPIGPISCAPAICPPRNLRVQ